MSCSSQWQISAIQTIMIKLNIRLGKDGILRLVQISIVGLMGYNVHNLRYPIPISGASSFLTGFGYTNQTSH